MNSTEVAVPTNPDDLKTQMELAKTLAVSSLLPQALRGKPADVLVTVMYGRELGLSPMQSLQGIYVVNGRPSMSGQLWLAKVRQAGHRVKIEATDKTATCTITRGDTGEEHTETFTFAEAERAKLTGKDVWKSWPKRMLTWRAVSNCATVVCPEVALGFEVTEFVRDELEPERPSLAQVAAERQQSAPASVPARDTVDAELVDPDEDEVRRTVEEMHAATAATPPPPPDDQDWPETLPIPGSAR